jgi:hypothetical protein
MKFDLLSGSGKQVIGIVKDSALSLAKEETADSLLAGVVGPPATFEVLFTQTRRRICDTPIGYLRCAFYGGSTVTWQLKGQNNGARENCPLLGNSPVNTSWQWICMRQ